VNSCSDAKPKEAVLEKAQARFADRIRQFFPIIVFGIGFVTAWMMRVFAVESVSSYTNLFVLFLATIATLLALNQRLPFQNMIAISVVIALFSGVMMLAASVLKVLVVPPIANEKFHHLPVWAAPLLWTIALVNARSIAKLFLHALRKKSNYGIALIALSSLLVATLNLHTEPAPKTFFVQLALAFAAFVATTPWFIDKKRIEQKPDFQPLLITILLMFW